MLSLIFVVLFFVLIGLVQVIFLDAMWRSVDIDRPDGQTRPTDVERIGTDG